LGLHKAGKLLYKNSLPNYYTFSKITESKEGQLSLFDFSPPLVTILRSKISNYKKLEMFILKYNIFLP
jgi:hypothetical protein